MPDFQYLLFYKPFQVLSQFSPEGEKRTLADCLPGLKKDIYPVGRLDYDSEGLLLLTNDKSINQKLLKPEAGHKKTYWAQVEGAPIADELKPLSKGVNISVNRKIHKTAPAVASLVSEPISVPDRNPPIRFRKDIPTTWISLTINEGKNRQVRKMTAAIGFPTLRLIRVSIGAIRIDQLMPGEFRALDKDELKQLFVK